MDNLTAKGHLIIRVFDKFGYLKQLVEVDNLVVLTGVNLLLSRLKDDTLDPISHMEIGTGTTLPTINDIELESPLVRVALETVSVDGSVISMIASFPDGIGTGEVTEAGLFNAETEGLMMSRTVFPVINKQENDTITITWLLTLATS